MKKFLLLFLSCIMLAPLLAHEFWLHPSKFFYKPGDRVSIKFLVGENYDGENWKGNKTRIQQLALYSSKGKEDLATGLTEKEGDSLNIVAAAEGTNVIIFNSINSFIELEAPKFLEYLKEDALTNAIDYREKNKENDSVGREFYQRSVKTIIQVGNAHTDITATPTSLPLDIVAVQNPYSLKDKDSITLKIFFKQQPLANQVIKIWHRVKNETIKAEILSDEKAEIRIPHQRNGRWMISTVRMERLAATEKAQWQSYWGSVTWGFE